MQMKIVKILHCAETIKGGIASYLRDLIPLQCAEYGARNVTILVPASQVGDLVVPTGVNVNTFDDSAKSRFLSACKLGLRSRAVLKDFEADIVHLHSTFAGFACRIALALRFRHTKIVYCAHGWAWDRPISSWSKIQVQLVERGLAVLAHKIICISRHEYESARRVGIRHAKLCLIQNGISISPPLKVAVDQPLWRDGVLRVLFVGRLDEQKGLDVLLEALSRISVDVQLLVAGSAVVDAAISPKDQLTIDVKYLGWMSSGEIEHLFSLAHVLVVPSRWEGFGLVAVEAMRAGLAVIGSSVGGLAEVIEDQVTGILVNRESPSDLACALSSLTPELARTYGENGRARMNALFDITRVHKQLAEIYSLDLNPRLALRGGRFSSRSRN